MDFNICIVQPRGYIHSAAFTELAELIAYGLQDLHHNARVGTNQILGNATNIIIGVHLLRPGQIAETRLTCVVFEATDKAVTGVGLDGSIR